MYTHRLTKSQETFHFHDKNKFSRCFLEICIHFKNKPHQRKQTKQKALLLYDTNFSSKWIQTYDLGCLLWSSRSVSRPVLGKISCASREKICKHSFCRLQSDSASSPRVCRDLSSVCAGPSCGHSCGLGTRTAPSLRGLCIHDWHEADSEAKPGLQDFKGRCGYSPPCLTWSKTIKSKSKNISYSH